MHQTMTMTYTILLRNVNRIINYYLSCTLRYNECNRVIGYVKMLNILQLDKRKNIKKN